MAINKVVYNGTSLVDISTDTVTPDKVLSGVTYHGADGVAATGTCAYDVDSSAGTATAADILAGKVAYVAGAEVTGTCAYDVDSSAGTAVASDILLGKVAYVGGAAVTGTADLSNLLPENIKAGVTINGVVGTYAATYSETENDTGTTATITD